MHQPSTNKKDAHPLKGQEVWSAEWATDVKDPRKPYTARTVDAAEK